MIEQQTRQRTRSLLEKPQVRYAVVTTFLGDMEVASRSIDISMSEDRVWLMKTIIWAVNNGRVVEVASAETLDEE